MVRYIYFFSIFRLAVTNFDKLRKKIFSYSLYLTENIKEA